METNCSIIWTGVFTLAGTALGLLVSLIRDCINNKNSLKLKEMDIFCKKKFDAYNELIYLSHLMLDEYNKSKIKKDYIKDAKEKGRYRKLSKKVGYYTDPIRKELLNIFSHLDSEKIDENYHEQFKKSLEIIKKESLSYFAQN